MRSYTIREAAEACGISYQAMRTRVDRGQLQVIKHDGTRRITEIELETAGLLGGSSDPEVVRLRSENAQLRQELQTMRALPARIEAEREALERMEQAFHQARAEKQTADQGAQAIRTQLEEIAAAGPIRALRLRHRLRAGRAEA
jgi:DNA anti-recombination protein RmuC